MFYRKGFNRIITKLFLLITLLKYSRSVDCGFNYACDYTCDFVCQYDPTTNSYYNSSITDTSTGYHGPACCSYTNTKTCVPITCGKDVNGTQLYQQYYYRPTCVYQCTGVIFMPQIIYQSNTGNYINYSEKLIISTGGDPYLGVCLIYCSNGLFLSNRSKMCVQKCDDDQFIKQGKVPLNFIWKICLVSCFFWKYQKYGSRLTHRCVNISSCPFDNDLNRQTYADNLTYQCVYICPSNSYAHPDSKICVSKCYGLYLFGNNILNICVKTVSQQLISTSTSLSPTQLTLIESNIRLKQKLSNLQTNILILAIIIGLTILGIIIFIIYKLCNKSKNPINPKMETFDNLTYDNSYN